MWVMKQKKTKKTGCIIIVTLRFGRCLEYFSFVFILGPVSRWVFWVCWGRAGGPERQRTQTSGLCFSGLLALSWRPRGTRCESKFSVMVVYVVKV